MKLTKKLTATEKRSIFWYAILILMIGVIVKKPSILLDILYDYAGMSIVIWIAFKWMGVTRNNLNKALDKIWTAIDKKTNSWLN